MERGQSKAKTGKEHLESNDYTLKSRNPFTEINSFGKHLMTKVTDINSFGK